MHIPWSTSCQYRMPVAVWKAMIKHHHGESGFALLHNDTIQALMDYKRARGLHSFDACVARPARARARSTPRRRSDEPRSTRSRPRARRTSASRRRRRISSGSSTRCCSRATRCTRTRRARRRTPRRRRSGSSTRATTRRTQTHAFDRMQMQFIVEIGAVVTGEVRFLQASGEKHRAVERRVQLGVGAVEGRRLTSTTSRASPRSTSRRCPTAATA